MSELRYVTLTGAGENTDISAMLQLSGDFPFVEWAVLYSPERAGTEPRYPSPDWLHHFADEMGAHANIAIHLCGAAAIDLSLFHVGAGGDDLQRAKELRDLVEKFDRVQFNMRGSKLSPELMTNVARDLVRSEKRTRAIVQYNPGNAKWALEVAQRFPDMDVLCDASGGRGISPQAWPTLSSRDFRRLGFAGGRSPTNIFATLVELAWLYPDRPIWVDMESLIRNERDELCFTLCEQALSETLRWQQHQWDEATAHLPEGSTEVAELDPFWREWWAGRALGLNMVAPPKNAARPMYLHRHSGSFYNPQSTTSDEDWEVEFKTYGLGFRPEGEHWVVQDSKGYVFGRAKSLREAGQLGLIRETFGALVPNRPVF